VNALGITWPLETWGVGCRGIMWGEVETEIEVVGPWVGENEWEVEGFILNSEY
jgi:hypothetical protein